MTQKFSRDLQKKSPIISKYWLFQRPFYSTPINYLKLLMYFRNNSSLWKINRVKESYFGRMGFLKR